MFCYIYVRVLMVTEVMANVKTPRKLRSVRERSCTLITCYPKWMHTYTQGDVDMYICCISGHRAHILRVYAHTHIATNRNCSVSPLAKEMSTPGNQKNYFYASIIIFPLLMILAY